LRITREILHQNGLRNGLRTTPSPIAIGVPKVRVTPIAQNEAGG
jgi:hypothetical protein